MKFFFLSLLLSFGALAFSPDSAEYPMGPLENLTPGSLCTHPDSYRYPEQIPYCKRDVDSRTKAEIFDDYRKAGYRLNPRNRGDYKIDHLIPLCAGGSNSDDNLWPQHETVYTQTDPLEGLGCEKLKEGKIKQAKLVELILKAKHNLSLVPETFDYLQSL